MAGISGVEINAGSTVCRMCGTAYGKLSGYFYKSLAQLYKGTGYLSICKGCLDYLYDGYLAQCNSPRDAARQVCRKLDLYWDESVYNRIEKDNNSRTIMSGYVTRINTYKNAGKSYDDTLEKENALWNFAEQRKAMIEEIQEREAAEFERLNEPKEEVEPVDDQVKADWGPSYTDDMYRELERRKQYWVDKLSSENVDLSTIGAQTVLRQIVQTEIDINKGRAAGDNVDKKVALLQSLLSDAMLKPSQSKDDGSSDLDKTPLGVWAWRYEHKRPLPEIDEEFKDVNGIRKYITIWLKGHLAKMVGLRNSYSQMYEDEIKRLSVEKIDYEDDTDDAFLADLFSEDGDDS